MLNYKWDSKNQVNKNFTFQKIITEMHLITKLEYSFEISILIGIKVSRTLVEPKTMELVKK